MARRPFLTSLTAISLLFMPAGSKGKLLMKPDCAGAGWVGGEGMGEGGGGQGGARCAAPPGLSAFFSGRQLLRRLRINLGAC